MVLLDYHDHRTAQLVYVHGEMQLMRTAESWGQRLVDELVERLGSLQRFYELVHGGAVRKKRKERRRIAKREREGEKEELKRIYLFFRFR